MVPYFKTGLESKEFCLWVVHESLTKAKATRALRHAIPDSDRYLADGGLEFVISQEWYLKGGRFSLKRVLRGWDEKLAQASARGYVGMRASGTAAWVGRKDWGRFGEYERILNESLARKPMIVICIYPLLACGAADVLDVARTHQFAIAKRVGKWEVVEWRTPPPWPDLYGTLTARQREDR